MFLKYKISLIALFILSISLLKAQGCSDAGFCSIKYKSGAEKKNSFAIGNVTGIGDGSTLINNTYLSYGRQLGKSVAWETKVNANYASGSIANHFNVGDILTNISFQVAKSSYKNNTLNAVAGFKIPLTSANDKVGTKPLPMAYQSSLGTFDFLFGGQFQTNNWEITQAWQIPLTKQNKNSFLKELTSYTDFPSSNKLQRKSDALVRVAYNHHKRKSKFSLKPNMLVIYHLANDTYENNLGQRKALLGSQGLTINLNVIGKYNLGKSQTLEFSVAAPALVRDSRPDGLTRAFTVGVEYKISF